MDQIFDRLGRLLRTMFDEEEAPLSSDDFADPDMQAAWEELDDYMKSEDDHPGTRTTNAGGSSYGQGGGSSYAEGFATSGGIPADLHEDYRNLDVPLSSSLDQISKAYKRLIRLHHPDRHAADAAEMAKATARTQKINYSYYRIRKYLQTGKVG